MMSDMLLRTNTWKSSINFGKVASAIMQFWLIKNLVFILRVMLFDRFIIKENTSRSRDMHSANLHHSELRFCSKPVSLKPETVLVASTRK